MTLAWIDLAATIGSLATLILAVTYVLSRSITQLRERVARLEAVEQRRTVEDLQREERGRR